MELALTGFDGTVVRPDDPGYEQGRAIWNALHDRRPAVIAYCFTPEQVVVALRHGRDRELPIAVRCGGHGGPGHGVCDDGLVIDVRGIDHVRVDPRSRRAWVGGGAVVGEVDRATQRHGLVVPLGVVSQIGVGGLTLGGGLGRLMRRFGATVDSLLSAEVVTAEGAIVRCSPDAQADLFWAIRGGGGNFGVVTEFEFALHELSEVLVLGMFHPLDGARPVLERAQAVGADAPEQLFWASLLGKAPRLESLAPEQTGEPGVLSLIEWSGDLGEGAERLSALQRELEPAATSVDVVPYLTIQAALDRGYGTQKHRYYKTGLVDRLTDAVIDELVLCGGEVGSPLSQIEVLAVGGAMSRVDADATAFPHRDAAWLINIPATWEAGDDTDAEIAWARRTFTALAPHMTGGSFANFMGGDEEGADAAAYGRVLERLRAVKAVYDPANLFRLNVNVRPR